MAPPSLPFMKTVSNQTIFTTMTLCFDRNHLLGNTDKDEMWEIKPAGDKGKGVFALQPISRGTLIMNEDPVVHINDNNYQPTDILASFEALPGYLKDRFWDLASFHNKQNHHRPMPELPLNANPDMVRTWDMMKARSSRVKSVNSIFYANSVSTSPGAAVFLTASRINHSCIPNASYHFNNNTNKLEVRVVHNVDSGEELCISYVDASYPTNQRQLTLRNSYGFRCDCPACGDSFEADSFASKSRERRYIMDYLSTRIYEWEPHKELADVEKLVQAYEDEGLDIQHKGAAYKRLALLYKRDRRDAEKAVAAMEKALDIYVVCSGPEAPSTKAVRKLLDDMLETERLV
jgi:hypothetical protein